MLRRRPTPIRGELKAALPKITGDVWGHVTKGLNVDGSQEDWIRQVKAEVDAADLRAHRAHVLAQRTDKRVTDLEARLSAEIARVRTDLETARKADAADTVPLAATGLAVTALGAPGVSRSGAAGRRRSSIRQRRAPADPFVQRRRCPGRVEG